jgi:hypothetical protein
VHDDRDAQVLKLADVASGVIPLQTTSNAMLAAVLWRLSSWLPFVRPVFEGRFPGVV